MKWDVPRDPRRHGPARHDHDRPARRGVRAARGAVTIGVHLALGRRTILGVGIGTALYVGLLNTL
ncbi:hypothetical protein ACFV4T_04555 [Streptomyces sp. NPDC059755]|uniref:hypothetical protein n=1 Tax=Streptomyces sp. NPDC059755 TaxID=3346934 RepID=UPI003657D3A6